MIYKTIFNSLAPCFLQSAGVLYFKIVYYSVCYSPLPPKSIHIPKEKINDDCMINIKRIDIIYNLYRFKRLIFDWLIIDQYKSKW